MGAAMKQHFERFNLNFEHDPQGREFISSTGHFTQESFKDFNILYCSVDTVRQLYTVLLDPDFIDSIENALTSETYDDRYYNYHGETWMLKRGGKSGYRYMLQNSELGLILLIKSNYVKSDMKGSHLKIEVSPHMIADKSPAELQALMDELAMNMALEGNTVETKGIAIHPAIDFQGWEPPSTIHQDITCRSRRITGNNGISELYLDNDVCSVHGRGQSFLFGSATYYPNGFIQQDIRG
jgi:hypothetical protein